MSEHKITCPECKRPPGGVHHPECSSSRESRRLLAASLEREPRFVCPPIGWPVFKGDDRDTVIVNPGIPYVRSTPKGKKPGKPWYAGGMRASIRHTPIVREVLNGQRPVSDLLDGRL